MAIYGTRYREREWDDADAPGPTGLIAPPQTTAPPPTTTTNPAPTPEPQATTPQPTWRDVAQKQAMGYALTPSEQAIYDAGQSGAAQAAQPPPSSTGTTTTNPPAATNQPAAKWDWTKQNAGVGQPQQYRRDQLVWRDGSLFAKRDGAGGEIPVNAYDEIIEVNRGGDESQQTGDARRVGTYASIGEILGTQDATANPFKAQLGKDKFIAQNRDVLYGAATGGYKNEVITNWDGSSLVGTRDEMRNKVGAANVQVVQSILRQLYPDATEEQLNNAAWAAAQKPRQVQQIWYGKYRTQTRDAGDAYDIQDSPLSIVRAIASEMPGGIDEKRASALAALEPKILEYSKKTEKGIDSFDDSNRGVTGFLKDLGPASMLIALIPGVGPILSAALQGVSAAERGDMGGVVKAAATYGAGQYINGLANADATGALADFAKSSVVDGVLTGKDILQAGAKLAINGPESALTSLTGSAVANMTGSQVLGTVAGSAVGLAINLSGLDAGSSAASGAGNSGSGSPPPAATTPPPATQPAPAVTTPPAASNPNNFGLGLPPTFSGPNVGLIASAQATKPRGGASTFNPGLIRRG